MNKLLHGMVIIIVAVGLLVPQAAVFAQTDAPECVPGAFIDGCDAPPVDAGTVNAEAAAGFKQAYSKTLKGGYVAHGVGMRNAGHGTIVVNDVPAGASVTKAFLFWALIGPAKLTGFSYNKGKINGSSITGSLIGSAANPNWFVPGFNYPPTWSYRADVTKKMKKGGNGTYELTSFASGSTNGSNPFVGAQVAPLLEGATLVIVYSKSDYPSTTVKIFNGAAATSLVDASQLHLLVPGINAVGLTGLTSTTFIGADGQNTAEPGSTFFTESLPAVAWDGVSVPNGAGANYPNGNLWDTQTVDLTFLVDPPEPDFWFTTRGDNDVLIWVAQVVSYATGNQDTDGDKLKDGWELHGVNGVDLPGFGADPLHKDLFIEADYMNGHDHLLDVAHLNDIVAVFANAPVTNPDGTTGINMHIDTGGAGTGSPAGSLAAYNLGGGNAVTEDTYLGVALTNGEYDWSEFQSIKNNNFHSSRLGIFHYMIFAHNVAEDYGGTSGLSRNGNSDAQFVKGASDFIVSLGSWDGGGTQEEREGTFVHELGHNLGLRHGGNDHSNWKPNYLSVMNYYYQTWGVYRNGDWGNFDYSRFLAPSLNEKSLKETTGLGAIAAGYGLRWWCSNLGDDNWSSNGAQVDWNCNNVINGSTVGADIDGSGKLATIKNQNNWASITFGGGGIIGSGASSGQALDGLAVTRTPLCLTYEDSLRIENSVFVEPAK